jgi:hypothetical protein
MRFHRTIATLAGVAVLLLTGAPAGAQAEHFTFPFSVDSTEPALGPCDQSPGVLTLRGDGIAHITDTGQTFEFGYNLLLQFTFDPDDPSLPSASGRLVAQHQENVNEDQLHRSGPRWRSPPTGAWTSRSTASAAAATPSTRRQSTATPELR